MQAHRSLPPQKGQSNTCDTFGFAFLGGGLARFRLPLRQGCGRGQGLEAGGDAGGTHIAASGGGGAPADFDYLLSYLTTRESSFLRPGPSLPPQPDIVDTRTPPPTYT